MDVRVGDEHVLPGAVHFSSCGMCRCAGVACAVCGVRCAEEAHHAPLRELDLALGQVGRPAARRIEAVPARVVQAVFGFECRDHYPCGRAAHGRLRVDPAGSFADVGAGLPWLTEQPAVVGHEDARALRWHAFLEEEQRHAQLLKKQSDYALKPPALPPSPGWAQPQERSRSLVAAQNAAKTKGK